MCTLANVNLNASLYVDLINRQKNITDSPILKTIPDKDIQLVVEKKEGEIFLLRLSCHTQTVERAVKIREQKLSVHCVVNMIEKV